MNDSPGRVAGVLLMAAYAGAAFAATPSFKGLGVPEGARSVVASAITPDGCTVVGSVLSETDSRPFYWTAESGIVELERLPGSITGGAADVSADGSVIVGSVGNAEQVQAFRWTRETGMVGLGILPNNVPEPYRPQSSASAVSADGSTIVGWSHAIDGGEAIRWTAETGLVSLGDLPGGSLSSFAHDVSSDGSVIIGHGSSTEGPRPVRWVGDSPPTELTPLNDPFPIHDALAVTPDGLTVVGGKSSFKSSDPPSEAFRWTEGTGATGLGQTTTPQGPTASGVASAVSDDGSTIMGYVRDRNGPLPPSSIVFYWNEADGMRPLRDVLADAGLAAMIEGWDLNLIFKAGLSADGLTLAGTGRNPNGQIEAWIATIPEPGAGLIVLIGALTLRRYRSRSTPQHRPAGSGRRR